MIEKSEISYRSCKSPLFNEEILTINYFLNNRVIRKFSHKLIFKCAVEYICLELQLMVCGNRIREQLLRYVSSYKIKGEKKVKSNLLLFFIP